MLITLSTDLSGRDTFLPYGTNTVSCLTPFRCNIQYEVQYQLLVLHVYLNWRPISPQSIGKSNSRRTAQWCKLQCLILCFKQCIVKPIRRIVFSRYVGHSHVLSLSSIVVNVMVFIFIINCLAKIQSKKSQVTLCISANILFLPWNTFLCIYVVLI